MVYLAIVLLDLIMTSQMPICENLATNSTGAAEVGCIQSDECRTGTIPELLSLEVCHTTIPSHHEHTPHAMHPPPHAAPHTTLHHTPRHTSHYTTLHHTTHHTTPHHTMCHTAQVTFTAFVETATVSNVVVTLPNLTLALALAPSLALTLIPTLTLTLGE